MDARNAGASPAAETQDREIVIARVFNAPRELVFKAWTDPKHLVRWWGPNGFSTTIQQMDVRPGGAWNHIMHGPDGTDYPNHSVFTEVVKPERLAYSHGGGKEGGTPADFHATVTFEREGGEEGNQTRVTLRMLFKSAALRNQIAKEYGAIEGGNQTFARLAEHLAEMGPETEKATAEEAAGGATVGASNEKDQQELFLTRVFDAPRALVFKAWTDPKRVQKWWGPRGFTNPVCELDVRPGGAMRIDMRGPDGTVYPMTGVYTEIIEPERLAFTSGALDKKGQPLFEVLTTVTFTEHAGKTTLKLHARVVKATPAAAPHLAGMQVGWTQTIDRLSEFVC
jgi:uncharacterized protein YndB with AHSA1/START domain